MLRYKLKARTATTTTTKKKEFTMRIRQNPNSNYFNSMFAHYVVLAMLPLCVYASSRLTNRSRSQSRHAGRVEPSRVDGHVRIHVRVFSSGFFPLRSYVYFRTMIILSIVQNHTIHKLFEFRSVSVHTMKRLI